MLWTYRCQTYNFYRYNFDGYKFVNSDFEGFGFSTYPWKYRPAYFTHAAKYTGPFKAGTDTDLLFVDVETFVLSTEINIVQSWALSTWELNFKYMGPEL